MVTIAHITKKILQEKPFIHEALEKDLVNIIALAEMIRPEIEKELGKVKTSAVSMAIRRYLEQTKKEFYNQVKISKVTDLLIKSNLFEISLLKSEAVYKKLMKLYDIVDFKIGDTLNIIGGNYEILIVSNEKYRKKFEEMLKGEKIKLVRGKLASVSVKIPQEFIDNPGFYFAITKVLAMNNISIYDIVNTETEATFILNDNDIGKAYDVLKKEISVEFYQKQ